MTCWTLACPVLIPLLGVLIATENKQQRRTASQPASETRCLYFFPTAPLFSFFFPSLCHPLSGISDISKPLREWHLRSLPLWLLQLLLLSANCESPFSSPAQVSLRFRALAELLLTVLFNCRIESGCSPRRSALDPLVLARRSRPLLPPLRIRPHPSRRALSPDPLLLLLPPRLPENRRRLSQQGRRPGGVRRRTRKAHPSHPTRPRRPRRLDAHPLSRLPP